MVIEFFGRLLWSMFHLLGPYRFSVASNSQKKKDCSLLYEKIVEKHKKMSERTRSKYESEIRFLKLSQVITYH